MESGTQKQIFITPIIEGYHNYIGTNGLSAKGGCGFYINDSLNSIPRKDLNIKLKDDNNEFESCWVEIINDRAKHSPRCILQTS